MTSAHGLNVDHYVARPAPSVFLDRTPEAIVQPIPFWVSALVFAALFAGSFGICYLILLT